MLRHLHIQYQVNVEEYPGNQICLETNKIMELTPYAIYTYIIMLRHLHIQYQVNVEEYPGNQICSDCFYLNEILYVWKQTK